MRIACIHVPQFALQSATRIDMSLRGAASIVVGGAIGTDTTSLGRGPVVQACSRAAWALGIRIGMTATAARAMADVIQSPDVLKVVSADPQIERDAVRAIADALLGSSFGAVVDIGGRVGPGGSHLAMYCEVPSKTRGTSFGDRVLERLEVLGFTGRVGIADDRFTAWVAASQPALPGGEPANHDGDVISVPRGGSAAFLAPRPLSLLAISPEVQHMLEALGVRTLGEFAALPAPSTMRPFEADYQALARGETAAIPGLRPYTPEAPVREELAIGGAFALTAESDRVGPPSGPDAIALLAERIALRLAGRGRGAARLEVTVYCRGEGPRGEGAGERVVPVSAAGASWRVLEDAGAIAAVLTEALGDELASAWRLRVVVTGEALAGDEAATARFASERVPVATSAARGADRAAPPPPPIDALDVVLSSTGSAWRLTSPSSGTLGHERRDIHRRTQRGKQRRRTRTPASVTTLAQPRLFKLS